MTFKNFMLIVAAVIFSLSNMVGEVFAVTEGDFGGDDYGGGVTYVSPIQDYDGLLPDVQELIDSGSTGVSDNWIVYRDTQDVYLEFTEDGRPISIGDTQWSYWLIFFGDDYDINWRMQSREDSAGLTVYVWPQLQIETPVIHAYRLGSEDFEDRYITDSELIFSAENAQWEHWGSASGWTTLTNYNSDRWTFGSTHELMLSHSLIASSVDISVPANTLCWYPYFEEGSAVPSFFQYTILATEFPSQVYDGYLTGEESEDDGSGTSTNGWLAKIYSVVKKGFEDVLDALNGDKEDEMEEEDEDGFSLKKLLEVVLKGLKSIVKGIGKWVIGGFGNIAQSIGDFFSIFDGTSATAGEGGGLFDWFGDSFYADDVAGATGFFGSLWFAFPAPVRALTNLAFGAFIAIAIIKIFLH